MVYLDYAAATPMDPRAFDAMIPYLQGEFGNASSIHQFGQRARKGIDAARQTCIDLLGAFSAHEIIFTGGGTESCNMALFGAAFGRQEQGKHIIISGLEHPAVREPAEYLRDNFGFELTIVNPDSEGLINPEDIKAALREGTTLVSVMYANNEVGSVQPIAEISKIVREHGALFHTDACQAPGYLDMNVETLGADLLTMNSTKIYGPKGVGLLYVREGVKITPTIHGGGQEFRMRGGTENVANIVGFAKAFQLVMEEDCSERIAELRDELLDAILKIPSVSLNGSRSQRLPNNINIHMPGMLGETLVMKLDIDGLAASSGSACSSGKTEPSPVLLAMGQDKTKALESLRLTLGRPTDREEIHRALDIIKGAIL
jgi:cysteine desulfurase